MGLQGKSAIYTDENRIDRPAVVVEEHRGVVTKCDLAVCVIEGGAVLWIPKRGIQYGTSLFPEPNTWRIVR